MDIFVALIFGTFICHSGLRLLTRLRLWKEGLVKVDGFAAQFSTTYKDLIRRSVISFYVEIYSRETG